MNIIIREKPHSLASNRQFLIRCNNQIFFSILFQTVFGRIASVVRPAVSCETISRCEHNIRASYTSFYYHRNISTVAGLRPDRGINMFSSYVRNTMLLPLELLLWTRSAVFATPWPSAVAQETNYFYFLIARTWVIDLLSYLLYFSAIRLMMRSCEIILYFIWTILYVPLLAEKSKSRYSDAVFKVEKIRSNIL